MKLLTARKLRLLMNLWPPFWGSSIKILQLDDDWQYAKVRLRKYWFNRNYVNTHYGGALFSMTDPFYMLLLLHKLGPDYVVWDKKAEIKFIKPGRKDVFAEFRLTEQELQKIYQQLTEQDVIEPVFEVDIHDTTGELIAKVWKTIHIARKRVSKK